MYIKEHSVSIHVYGLGYVYVTYMPLSTLDIPKQNPLKYGFSGIELPITYVYRKCLTWYVHSYNPASKLQRIMKSILYKESFDRRLQPEAIGCFSIDKHCSYSGKVWLVESLANLANH